MNTIEPRALEYEEAHIFRVLLVPRLVGLIGVILLIVVICHLPWRIFVGFSGIAGTGVAVAIRMEFTARRRMRRAAAATSAAMGIQPRTGSRPTVP